MINPAGHVFLRGNGRAATVGWPTSPKIEELRDAWFRAPDLAAQKALADKLQLQAFEDVPYIPLGQYFIPTAYQANLTGMLQGSPVFWNISAPEGRTDSMSRIRTRLGFPLRRRGIAGVGCVQPAAAVLRHPWQAHQRAVGGRRRAQPSWDFPEVVGSFGLCLLGPPRRRAAPSRRAVRSAHQGDRATDRPGGRTADQSPQRRQGRARWLLLGRQHGRELAARRRRGALYRVTPQGRIERKAEGYAVSNGLAWSPDGRIMYHSDSTAGIIEAWDFDANRRAGQPPRAGDADQRGWPPRRRCRRCGRRLLVGRAVRRLHQPLLTAGRAAEQAAVPGSRPDNAVLRRTPSLRHVAARGAARRRPAAASRRWAACSAPTRRSWALRSLCSRDSLSCVRRRLTQ